MMSRPCSAGTIGGHHDPLPRPHVAGVVVVIVDTHVDAELGMLDRQPAPAGDVQHGDLAREEPVPRRHGGEGLVGHGGRLPDGACGVSRAVAAGEHDAVLEHHRSVARARHRGRAADVEFLPARLGCGQAQLQ